MKEPGVGSTPYIMKYTPFFKNVKSTSNIKAAWGFGNFAAAQTIFPIPPHFPISTYVFSIFNNLWKLLYLTNPIKYAIIYTIINKPSSSLSRIINMISPELHDRRFTRSRSFSIKQLWSSHEAMLRLTALGLNNKQVAHLTGVTPQTVSNTRNSPSGRTRLLEYSSSLDQQMLSLSSRIKEFAPQAESLLEDIVSGSIPAPIGLRARYAADLLDRAGHSPIKKLMSVSTTLSKDDIEAIKSRAIAAAQANGVAIEGEYNAS